MTAYHKLNLVFICFFLLAVFGCKNKDAVNSEKLRGTWALQSVSGEENAGERDELLASSEQNDIVRRGVSLSFFEDQSFTDIRGDGYYESGNWSFDENENILSLNGKSKKEKFSVTSTFEGKILRVELLNLATNVKMGFVRMMLPVANYKEDQFYAVNNFWRIKAKRPESIKELQSRMANHIKQSAYILKNAFERKSTVVSFAYSLGPIEIFQGSIGCHIYGNISDTWKNVFYNDDDAFRAYQVFNSYIRENRPRGRRTSDWTNDDYLILQKIYTDFATKKLYFEE